MRHRPGLIRIRTIARQQYGRRRGRRRGDHRAGEAADTAPADVAPARLIRSSWRILDRHSTLFAAVSATLTPDRMRERHERLLGPIRRLLLDGRTAGTIRADLPADWLVTVLYSLVHAAAAEVQAGRLTAEAAPEVLTTTILAAVRP
ncbi:hypothetical protein [Embleya hyalina]|uniref:hypothetical protein n=1 Tax=Embleya hyalina TaxID=516124 RepID=UPI000F81858E|nr:hypothetical protein [Embleya hyalina]